MSAEERHDQNRKRVQFKLSLLSLSCLSSLLTRACSSSCPREGGPVHAHLRAPPDLRFHLDVPAHRGHRVAHRRQSQPGAAIALRREEQLEHPLPHFRRHPATGIGHGQRHESPRRRPPTAPARTAMLPPTELASRAFSTRFSTTRSNSVASARTSGSSGARSKSSATDLPTSRRRTGARRSARRTRRSAQPAVPGRPIASTFRLTPATVCAVRAIVSAVSRCGSSGGALRGAVRRCPTITPSKLWKSCATPAATRPGGREVRRAA